MMEPPAPQVPSACSPTSTHTRSAWSWLSPAASRTTSVTVRTRPDLRRSDSAPSGTVTCTRKRVWSLPAVVRERSGFSSSRAQACARKKSVSGAPSHSSRVRARSCWTFALPCRVRAPSGAVRWINGMRTPITLVIPKCTLDYNDCHEQGRRGRSRVARTDPHARQRIVAGAADMLRRHGLNATSIRETAKHAKAPLGSTYHYFPGGKQQLATEAVQYAGDLVSDSLQQELRAGPVEGLESFLQLWRTILADTDYRAGCPVLAAAVEEHAADEGSPVRAAAAQVFDAWEGSMASSLEEHGLGPEEARGLATLVVASAEGAVAICRAQRDTAPL